MSLWIKVDGKHNEKEKEKKRRLMGLGMESVQFGEEGGWRSPGIGCHGFDAALSTQTGNIWNE